MAARAPARAAEAGSGIDVGFPLDLSGERAEARASGALWLPARRALVVADLHLGKSERLARAGGPLLPPYEGLETLERLRAEIERLGPKLVISLGDAFDDAEAALSPDQRLVETLLRLMAGRRWIWMLGNHDPIAPTFGGEGRLDFKLGPLDLRHEARAAAPGDGRVEVSGHFHPKSVLTLRGRRLSRRCFLWSGDRLILPAFGAYTGGLCASSPAFSALLGEKVQTLLLSGGRVLAMAD